MCTDNVDCFYHHHRISSRHIVAPAATTPSSSSSYRDLIEKVSLDAAIRAGEIILKASGTISLETGISSKIGSRDIVTEVDQNAQDCIKTIILKSFPSHKFLGEEDIAPGIEASTTAIRQVSSAEHLWIVDPIDGTTNFAHGMPLCGVKKSLALYYYKMSFHF